jgi:cytochrome c oxidase subunit 2
VYIYLTVVTGTVAVLIFLTILYFAIKYRRRSEDERPRPIRGSLPLEVTWIVVPLIFFLSVFGWSARVYYTSVVPPADALQLYVVGKQWMWKIRHPDGQQEINDLHVPVGRPVQLILTSQDVIHSFYIPAFRIKKDAVPGAYTTIWFEAEKAGAYHIFCAEYCGTNHSHMVGTVYAMQPADYQRWLSGTGATESLAAAGERLFQRLGCANCHPRICPNLEGLYMKQVPLHDGRIVTADDAYLRESILDPGAKIVGGFPNIMPSFKGLIAEEGLVEILSYIKSLGSPATAGPGAGVGAGRGTGVSAGPALQEQRGGQRVPAPAEGPWAPQSGKSQVIEGPPGEKTKER